MTTVSDDKEIVVLRKIWIYYNIAEHRQVAIYGKNLSTHRCDHCVEYPKFWSNKQHYKSIMHYLDSCINKLIILESFRKANINVIKFGKLKPKKLCWYCALHDNLKNKNNTFSFNKLIDFGVILFVLSLYIFEIY